MADNANVTAGDGSIIVATDKIGAVDYQRIKVTWGPDGTANDVDTAAGKPLPVQMRSAVATATVTSLASSATSAQLLASTAGRLGLLLSNTDANDVYVKYGTTASLTSFTVKIPGNYYWEMPHPVYTGRIDAIWAADGTGSLYATELT